MRTSRVDTGEVEVHISMAAAQRDLDMTSGSILRALEKTVKIAKSRGGIEYLVELN